MTNMTLRRIGKPKRRRRFALAAHAKSSHGSKSALGGEVVGCVEVDFRAIQFVSLEHAEWRRVDVNCNQVLTTDVWISQLVNIRIRCVVTSLGPYSRPDL